MVDVIVIYKFVFFLTFCLCACHNWRNIFLFVLNKLRIHYSIASSCFLLISAIISFIILVKNTCCGLSMKIENNVRVRLQTATPLFQRLPSTFAWEWVIHSPESSLGIMWFLAWIGYIGSSLALFHLSVTKDKHFITVGFWLF